MPAAAGSEQASTRCTAWGDVLALSRLAEVARTMHRKRTTCALPLVGLHQPDALSHQPDALSHQPAAQLQRPSGQLVFSTMSQAARCVHFACGLLVRFPWSGSSYAWQLRWLAFALLLAVVAPTGLSVAQQTPATQQTSAAEKTVVTADNAEINAADNQVTYSGNVVITRGNLRLQADRVEYVQQDNQQTFDCWGTPVVASWPSTANPSKYNRAEARHMKYLRAVEEVLSMSTNVRVQIDDNRVESHQLNYNLTRQLLNAGGDKGKQVRFVISNDK